MVEKTNLSKMLEDILGGLMDTIEPMIRGVIKSVSPSLMGGALQIFKMVTQPLMNILTPFIERVLNFLDPLSGIFNTLAEFVGFLIEPLIAHVVSPALRGLVDGFNYLVGAEWAVERMGE
jgi:phage-related protein